MKKKILVCGAGGFIGGHLVKKLKKEGYWVRGIDIKYHEFTKTEADDFIKGDLRDPVVCKKALSLENGVQFDEVYQLAADMGGAGHVFVGKYDFDIMHNSALINLNISNLYERYKKIFYSSSACVYRQDIQTDTNNPGLKENDIYPANPDSEYGWEKIFSERIYLTLMKNKGVQVRIARFHNIFGPEGTWTGGREKAPAAVSRKVAQAKINGEIEIWGDGEQTRSFLYVDECLDGIQKLMDSDYSKPINIGSSEIISINNLVKMVSQFDNKNITIKHIDGPLGVRGRTSDNTLIENVLGWKPDYPLEKGMLKTYEWIKKETSNNN